jgi:iron complex transport system ATP-binding protein
LIARALAQDTPLLLADEPTSGLDPSHQIALMRALSNLTAEGRAVVVSLHDLGLAARWCSRLLLLERGNLIVDGPPEAVLAGDHLRSVYGVEFHAERVAGQWIVQPLELIEPQGKQP